MIVNNNKLVLGSSRMKSNDNFDPITIAYISGMTSKPDYLHTRLIDKFVVTVKSIIQNKADVFYLGNINNSNDSFRNLVKNAHHGKMSGNTFQFDPYWGFGNPSGTSYVDTNYNPNTQGVKYQLNDAAVLFSQYELARTVQVQYNFGCRSISTAVIEGRLSADFYMLNGDSTTFSVGTAPFRQGVNLIRRTASNALAYVNQNITNVTSTQVSTSVPNAELFLYRRFAGDTSNPFFGILNCMYVGASLTDAEYIIMNNAINDYLIQCLFLKYGLDNWGVQMAKSYFLELHNFERYEAWEVYEFIKRHQSDYVTVPVEISVNSGAVGMTDWINPTNGLAQGWQDRAGNGTASIVTGNGFTGNAQRLEWASGTATYMALQAQSVVTAIGRTYKVTLKYRATKALRIGNAASALVGSATLPINTGNASYVEITGTSDLASNISVIMPGTPVSGDYFEVDELSYKEVAESAYLYTTFQPTKTVADYIMLFKAGGNLIAQAWTKSGTNLRWNQDGTIASSNTLPAYTRGNNLGVVTVTSTDGFNSVSSLIIQQTVNSVNSFYGNFPLLWKIKSTGCRLIIRSNRIKFTTVGTTFPQYSGIRADGGNPTPGYIKVNLNEFVGWSFTDVFYIYGELAQPKSKFIGDMTLWTNEIKTTTPSFIIGYDRGVIGSLENLVFVNATENVQFPECSLTKGFRTWRTSFNLISFAGNSMPTTEIDYLLSFVNTFYGTNTPIKNLSFNLSGTNMGIPTGGASNTDLLGIVAKFVAAGFVATITVRTV